MFNIDPQHFYRVKEAAQIFDVHVMTVYKWIEAGKLPIIDIRGRIYISGETIIKLIRAAVRIRQSTKGINQQSLDLLPLDLDPRIEPPIFHDQKQQQEQSRQENSTTIPLSHGYRLVRRRPE